MAPPAFNFSTAVFHCEERSIQGSTSTGPRVYLKMGGALFRAIYSYRNTGLVMGALGGGFPLVLLTPMDAGSEWCVMPQLNPEIYPDSVDGYDYFGATLDDKYLIVVGSDPTFAGGTPAAPEVEAWCTQLGGTYTGL